MLKIQQESNCKASSKYVEKIQNFIDDKVREKAIKKKESEEEKKKKDQESLKSLVKQAKSGTKPEVTIKQIAMDAGVTDAEDIAKEPKYNFKLKKEEKKYFRDFNDFVKRNKSYKYAREVQAKEMQKLNEEKAAFEKMIATSSKE